MIRRLVADLLSDLADWFYDQALRLDPPETVSFRLDAFDGPTSAETFTELMRPWYDRAEQSREEFGRYFDRVADLLVIDDTTPGVVWRDPTVPSEALREDILAKISESMQKPVPVLPVGANYPIDFEAPSPFAEFIDTDVRPYMDIIDAQVRVLAQQYHDAKDAHLAGFLDEVGDVAPGFDSETAREILRERES